MMAYLKKRIHSFHCGFALFWFILLLAPCPLEAEDVWWNDAWQYRKKINLNTSATGAGIQENLSDVTVLLRLHTGNFNFTNAREDGGDIRFVASDDATLLKHHIERIDTLDEIALVWVKVPAISGGTDQGFIYMYYGNENAIGGQDSGGTFDASQVAAYHLGEVEGAPKDATANNNHVEAFSGGQGLPGVIGNGVAFNGSGDQMKIPESLSMDFSAGFTISAWVRINFAQSDAWLFSKSSESGSLIVGIEDTKIYASIAKADGQLFSTERSADLPVGSWHLLTIAGEPGNRLTIYLDGMEMTWANLPGAIPSLAGEMIIGDDAEGGHSYIGDLDEVGIFNKPLTNDYIRAAFAVQGPEGLFFSFGEELMGGGESTLPVFYLGTILKNITLDGLLVILLLMALSAVSWVVFIKKAIFLVMAGRENKAFLSTYQDMEDPVQMTVEEEDFKNSNLYEIFRAGRAVLKRNGSDEDEPGSRPKLVSSQIIKSLQVELEKTYINETKRLNGNLTVLTMAISGGPFLGLLGTVWGVMNTFAAMAEAGEANIMAIAPGVASALSTTVVGLIVAIPALFAYNFLTSRIKEITADLTVFVDEFAVRIENGHGGGDETGLV